MNQRTEDEGGRAAKAIGSAFCAVVLSSILFLPSSAETPPDIAVRALASPTTAYLGDLVSLDIHVDHSLSLAVETPAFEKSLGAFEIFSSSRVPVRLQEDRAIDDFHAELQAFTTGAHTIPALEIPFSDPMGKRSVVKTPELTVTIGFVPPTPKDKGLRGIKGVIGPVAWPPWGWLLAALGLAAAGWFFWRRRRKSIAGPPPPPPIPADEKALRRLIKLRESGWIAAGKLKEFYSGLSDVLRGYLEDGFDIEALERTTYELMRELGRVPRIDAARQGELRRLLEQCDLVKFAKFRPESGEAEADLQRGVEFVTATRSLLRPPDTDPGQSSSSAVPGGRRSAASRVRGAPPGTGGAEESKDRQLKSGDSRPGRSGTTEK